MPLTQQQLLDLGYKIQPDGSYAKHPAIAQNAIQKPFSPAIPHSIPKHPPRAALGDLPKGENQGTPRTSLRITRRAGRLLDADNLAGGCKPLIDALRYAGIIQDDDPETIEITFRQEKVAKSAQGTLIEVLTSEPDRF